MSDLKPTPDPKDSNVEPVVNPTQQQQVLKFLFTPQAPPREELRRKNPHAKQTTYLPEDIEALREAFGDDIGEVVEYANEQTVYVAVDRIVDVCRFLKQERGFTYLSDMGAIDRFTETERFEVFYSLVSIEARKRLRVKVRVPEDETAPSITSVHRSANWHEREAWDMMGIKFSGHPDLRRMFMPEDFAYHPQRKEFPTLGIPGSLPLPPQRTDGAITPDPFARAHGQFPKD
jgi:NADH-quinone oxidoreductase subunit C